MPPLPRLVATVRSGIGSWSKSRAPRSFTSRRSSASSATPLTTPFGAVSEPLLRAELRRGQRQRSPPFLRRIGSSTRGGVSLNSLSVVILPIAAIISSTVMPDA